MVPVEKMLFAALRALVAGTLMLPLGRRIIGPLSPRADRAWILILFVEGGRCLATATVVPGAAGIAGFLRCMVD